jgi:hypothetical protein
MARLSRCVAIFHGILVHGMDVPIVKASERLDLSDLAEGCPALTSANGVSFCEAASVCLSRKHSVGVSLVVKGDHQASYETHWPTVTDQMERANHDLQDATRDGAYGIAILLAKRASGYTVVQKSRKGTGFDYWVGNDGDQLFQNKARLEVSGILEAAKPSIMNARVKKKERQTTRSDQTNLPACVVVVEFGSPRVSYTVRS